MDSDQVIFKFHWALLGEKPSLEHRQLYTAFCGEKKRGFSGEPTEDSFLATVILALWQTRQGLVTVVLPKPLERPSLVRLGTVARPMFRRFKGQELTANTLRESFHKLRMTSAVLHIPEPDRWVSIGFSPDDPIPQWLSRGVLNAQ